MKKTKEIENQERRFLRLCSDETKEMIKKKRKMTLNDFDRFFYILITLGMMDYAIYFAIELFPELLIQSSDLINERDEVYELYYSQEDNLYAEMDKSQIWLQEFWNQMPLERQQKKYKELFAINKDITDPVAAYGGSIEIGIGGLFNDTNKGIFE